MEAPRPLDALNKARGRRVMIDLKNGKTIAGSLNAFDIHINCVLDNAEEIVDNEVKKKMGTVFVRGDTILTVSLT